MSRAEEEANRRRQARQESDEDAVQSCVLAADGGEVVQTAERDVSTTSTFPSFSALT